MGVRFEDGSPEQLFHALHRKHSIAVDTLLYRRGLGNIGQPMILTILSQRKDGTIASQKELAKILRVSPATVTVSLKSMERDGYIKKLVNTQDQRCKPITITEKGRDAAHRVNDVFAMLDAGIYRGFTQEELDTVSGFYRRMLENLDAVVSDGQDS